MTYECYPPGVVMSGYMESGETMYFLLDGEIEVKYDIKRKNLNENELQDLILDLDLSSSVVNSFL